MYLIKITHPSLDRQHTIGGVDEENCLKALKESYPNGGYTIVSSGWK